MSYSIRRIVDGRLPAPSSNEIFAELYQARSRIDSCLPEYAREDARRSLVEQLLMPVIDELVFLTKMINYGLSKYGIRIHTSFIESKSFHAECCGWPESNNSQIDYAVRISLGCLPRLMSAAFTAHAAEMYLRTGDPWWREELEGGGEGEIQEIDPFVKPLRVIYD